MNKKKMISLIAIVAIFAGGVYAAKNSSGGYIDGTYYVEGQSFDNQGWKPFLEVTVEDKRIADVNFDYINAEGSLKTKDDFYNKLMLSIVDTCPTIFAKEFAVELMVKQNIDDFDGVSGATSSARHFSTVAEKLLANAKEGNTDRTTIVVE